MDGTSTGTKPKPQKPTPRPGRFRGASSGILRKRSWSKTCFYGTWFGDLWQFMAIYGESISYHGDFCDYLCGGAWNWLCDGSKLVGYSVGVIIPWKIWKIKHSSNCSNQQPCLASVRHGKHKEVRQITSTPFGQSHSHQGELCFLKTDGYTITKLVTASQGVYCLPFSTVATNRSDPLSTYVATWLPENIRKLNLKSIFISDGVQCLHKSTTGPPYPKNSKMLSLDNCHDLT